VINEPIACKVVLSRDRLNKEKLKREFDELQVVTNNHLFKIKLTTTGIEQV
jgi:hypothetical protein